MRGPSSADDLLLLARALLPVDSRRLNEITWLTTGKPVTTKYCLISGTCWYSASICLA